MVGGLQCSTVEYTLADGHDDYDDDDNDDNADDGTLKFSAISKWRQTAVKDTTEICLDNEGCEEDCHHHDKDFKTDQGFEEFASEVRS